MIDLRVPDQSKSSEFTWIDFFFYVTCAVLIVVIFCYFTFSLKSYWYYQKIDGINKSIAVYGTAQDKLDEKKALDEKKKIDDFLSLLGTRKISSNLFAFVEKNTLPSVWFSNFDLSESDNEVRLLGEADTMAALGLQIQTFENNKDYVKNITVLDSKINLGGKVKFSLSILLNPIIFDYDHSLLSIPNP